MVEGGWQRDVINIYYQVVDINKVLNNCFLRYLKYHRNIK